MRFLSRIVLVMIAASIVNALSGCGSVAGDAYEAQPVPASKAMIYIYRQYHFTGSEAVPMITCGSDSIELLPGGYHSFFTDPGAIACVSSGTQSGPLKFDVHAGGEYYVKEEVSGSLNTVVKLTLVNGQTAKTEIVETRRQSVASKFTDDKSPPPPGF